MSTYRLTPIRQFYTSCAGGGSGGAGFGIQNGIQNPGFLKKPGFCSILSRQRLRRHLWGRLCPLNCAASL
ncbi:hypothetical protein [Kamptonema formosum]|uniref:hypothetical protein n=1 Tax=Kamptonema formosum TaxID=331992 RepID=UPI0012DD6157|nr:hypothetical protein [Oscillatoria sp. PCC 10802]